MSVPKSADSISWARFEVCNADRQSAFENMCRLLFNAYFFKGKALLHSEPNNPGIEVVPVAEETGKRISFQSKYFASTDYAQIKHSAEAAVKHYEGLLDIVYLYCNKDVDTTSKAYKNIEEILSKSGISLVPICNQTILEQVQSNNIAAWQYFNEYHLDDHWFENQLNNSLTSLGARFNPDFNVDTHAENFLNLFLCNNDAITQINNTKNAAVEALEKQKWRYSHYIKIYDKIFDAISDIEDVSIEHITACLSWQATLNQKCSEEYSKIKEIVAQKEAEYTAAIDKQNYSKSSRLSGEINDLDDLLHLSNHIIPDGCSFLDDKMMVVRGNAGVGKSQLLANTANKMLQANQYVILLLGENYLGVEPVGIQTLQLLGITDISLEALLYKLEGLGCQNDRYSYIFIDAINESAHKEIWKSGLQSLLTKVEQFNNIKVVISVRTGYETMVFSEAVDARIRDGSIASIVHNGLQEESVKATLAFLDYYGIPFVPSYFLQSEMTNPLFLILFCRYYSNNDFDIFSLFERLIDKANCEAQRAIGFENLPVLHALIDEIALVRLTNGTLSIKQSELFSLRFWDTYGLTAYKVPFVASLVHSGFFISSAYDGVEVYHLGYNLLEDFVCAKAIMSNHSDKAELESYLVDDILSIKDGNIHKYNNVDIFVIACGLFAERHRQECFLSIIERIKGGYERNDIVKRYVESFLWRKKSSVDTEAFIDVINNYHVGRDVVFRVLIENSVKEYHPLNAKFLHELLLKKTITHRDYLWTTYINGLSYEEERLFQLICYFEKGNMLDGLSDANTELLLILLTWLLTSSNRVLRDKASKASTELLKSNFSLCKPLLQQFAEVNDPYVLQRLFGNIFGACTKRNAPEVDNFRDLAEYVYNYVFNKDAVYPDALLRDYARLILERWIFEFPADCAFIDIAKINPPYHSVDIPTVEPEEYYQEGANHSGFNAICFSMYIDAPGCPGMYGDFGRYTFQAALQQFENVDILNLYHYAMHFIRDELGYTDELFGDYDSSIRQGGYSRHDTKKIERIGKKYQWIALYNILARISDTHHLHNWEGEPYPFLGAWDPYVRDFDPTLNSNFLIPPELPVIYIPKSEKDDFLAVEPFPTVQDIEMWKNTDSELHESLPKKMMVNDSNGNTWVALNFYKEKRKEPFKHRDSAGFSKGTQHIWMMSCGYFIKTAQLKFIKENADELDLFSTDFPRGADIYQLFSREYAWSSGYQDVFNVPWTDCQLATKTKKVFTQTAEVPDFQTNEDDEFFMRLVEKTQKYMIPEKTVDVQLLPSYSRVLWESEYDASQRDATAFDIPCGNIINCFHLAQKKYDGYYYTHDNILVCFDGTLSGIYNGLLIRKDFLEKFLSDNDLKLFWVCTGEKQFFYGDISQEWSQWSGLCFLDNGIVHGDLKQENPHY